MQDIDFMCVAVRSLLHASQYLLWVCVGELHFATTIKLYDVRTVNGVDLLRARLNIYLPRNPPRLALESQVAPPTGLACRGAACLPQDSVCPPAGPFPPRPPTAKTASAAVTNPKEVWSDVNILSYSNHIMFKVGCDFL